MMLWESWMRLEFGNHALGTLVFNHWSWWPLVVVAVLVLCGLMFRNYISHNLLARPAAWLAMTAKAIGFTLIALCLLEPMQSLQWPRPQENVVGILVDASQSMNVGLKADALQSMRENVLSKDSDWQRQVAQDFDIRRYEFGWQTAAVDDFSAVDFSQRQSNIAAALNTFNDRMQQRPVSAIVVFTDGNATDQAALESMIQSDSSASPAIFPVLVRQPSPLTDLRISNVAVEVADFENAPIALDVWLAGENVRGRDILLQVMELDGSIVADQKASLPADRDEHRLQVRFNTTKTGVQRYRLQVALAGERAAIESDDSTLETTLANNRRFVIVDRGAGPYRILYVAGRPNWEFKFLRRALSMDPEMDLVGLIRIARREAKFTFRDNSVDNGNSLFSGFEDDADASGEQYDEPVFTRFGVRDAFELKGGFPETQAELFSYQMIIIDDLESDFFTSTQSQMLRRFVSQRGGSLMMLGGVESFRGRGFDNGPLSQLMPLYFDQRQTTPTKPQHFMLTREGWLQPSLRIADNETKERERLQAMPPFLSANHSSGTKPGAVVYVANESDNEKASPILATQRFGEGRSAAFLLSDFWRWAIANPAANLDGSSDRFGRRKQASADDEKTNPAFIAWRQMMRWMITDVPRRVEFIGQPASNGLQTSISNNLPSGLTKSLAVRVRDEEFQPLDNAQVQIELINPANETLPLQSKASDRSAGAFETDVYVQQDGAYLATATATTSDGNTIGNAATGFVVNAAAEEYSRLQPNVELLERLAARTGGELIAIDDLDSLASRLPFMNVEQTVRRVEPLWHQSLVLIAAFVCLLGEWTYRRWHGLP